ncbi:hypothetical protein H632_c3425p1, partial [Helicosporidium sp. ATCC 50920]
IEMLGSSVEKMSVIDANNGYPMMGGYMQPQGGPQMSGQYPGAPVPPGAQGYAQGVPPRGNVPQPANKHLAGAYPSNDMLRSNSAI